MSGVERENEVGCKFTICLVLRDTRTLASSISGRIAVHTSLPPLNGNFQQIKTTGHCIFPFFVGGGRTLTPGHRKFTPKLCFSIIPGKSLWTFLLRWPSQRPWFGDGGTLCFSRLSCCCSFFKFPTCKGRESLECHGFDQWNSSNEFVCFTWHGEAPAS